MSRAYFREDPDYYKVVQERRKREEERRKRIFNPVIRTIGIDKESLDKRTQEQKARELKEQQDRLEHDRQQIAISSLLSRQQQQHQMAKRQHAREVQEYNRTHIRPERTPEWDINDPDRLRKDQPIRLGDVDPRLGPSSGQVFDGEDLQGPAREAQQKEALRLMLEQQQQEKASRLAREAEQRKQDEQRELSIVEHLRQMDVATAAGRRQMSERTRQANQRAREERLAAEAAHQAKLRELENKHVETMVQSEFMTEPLESAYSSTLPGRMVPYAFKGLSAQQKADGKEAIRQQAEARRKRERAEAEAKAAAEARELAMLRELKLQEQRHQRSVRSQAFQLRKEQEEASRRAAARRAAEDPKNKLDESFYSYFQTSSR